MLIKTLAVGHLETNCYIVTDENTCKCAIIDPGAESNTILDYIESNNLKAESIFITHGHYDHFMALDAVLEATDAPIYLHGLDVDIANHFGGFYFKNTANQHRYSQGDVVNVGNLVFKVIETPGHSPGSVTLQCENALFTGDTLFRSSCGRTDFEGGNRDLLYDSLRLLAALEGDYEVYPGHAESTTLSRERSFNRYMIAAIDEL